LATVRWLSALMLTLEFGTVCFTADVLVFHGNASKKVDWGGAYTPSEALRTMPRKLHTVSPDREVIKIRCLTNGWRHRPSICIKIRFLSSAFLAVTCRWKVRDWVRVWVPVRCASPPLIGRRYAHSCRSRYCSVTICFDTTRFYVLWVVIQELPMLVLLFRLLSPLHNGTGQRCANSGSPDGEPLRLRLRLNTFSGLNC
jgi:hypothetical protein